MIIVTDITILFSDLVSLIVPLQTWNVKYYKYPIIKNGLKSLLSVNKICSYKLDVNILLFIYLFIYFYFDKIDKNIK